MEKKIKLIKIGNSRGIRIPQSVIESIGNPEELIMEVKEGEVVLKADLPPRANWDRLFAEARKNAGDKDEFCEVDFLENDFDEDEWVWE